MTVALTGLSVRVLRALVVVTAVAAVLVAGWWVVQARAEATEASVQVCVRPDATLRLADTCRQNETPLQLATAGGLQATDQRVADLEAANAALEARVAALEGLLAGVTRGEDTFGRDTLRLSGVNLQLDNGHEEAVTATSNGLGNLIIGHNTLRPADNPADTGPTTAADRGGSHYVIIGDWHHWTGSGGYVAGHSNTAHGPGATVAGGQGNTASGFGSWVSGRGPENRAVNGGTVFGGGGGYNTAGVGGFVFGGEENSATPWGYVFGGADNVAESEGFVFGGSENSASRRGVVFGGDENDARSGAMVVNSIISDATNAYVFGAFLKEAAADGSFWVGNKNLAE